MQFCLTHPVHGYYHRTGPIGRGGDFHHRAGGQSDLRRISRGMGRRPLRNSFAGGFDLVELGPGRGTLMADLWRSLKRLAPGVQPGGPVLIEISKKPARRTGAGARKRSLRSGTTPFADLPDSRSAARHHRQRVLRCPARPPVSKDRKWLARNGSLAWSTARGAWGLNPTPIADSAMPAAVRAAASEETVRDAPRRRRIDVDPFRKAGKARRRAARHRLRLCQNPGQADTIQAVSGHAFADPLAAPGTADLTAHVDFEALAAATSGLTVHPLMTQGAFLAALGAGERAQALARANPDRADAIATDLQRLAAPDQMGDIFKLLCVFKSRRFGLILSPKPTDSP